MEERPPDFPGSIVVTVADPFAGESRALFAGLWDELRVLYGREMGPVPFRPEDVVGEGKLFVLARLDGQAVGCGAFRPHGPGAAELKRMFVRADARRKGVGRAILVALEAEALRMGYHTLRLETGILQPDAISLYRSCGFAPIPCFDEYAEDPRSICFEKQLRCCQPKLQSERAFPPG